MKNYKKYIPIVLVLLVGAILRFYNLTAISLWHDEAFSALLIKYSWSEMFYRIGLDVHPPMYYIFLRFWHYLFGSSLLALRAMSVFFGLATILAGYAFVKKAIKSEKGALFAAILLAVNPFQIQYVTEARMYTMGAFFALLGALFLMRALEGHKDFIEKKSKILSWKVALEYLGFALSVIVIIYTHYYLLFTAAALGLYALIFMYRHKFPIRSYGYLFGAVLLCVLAYLPWLSTFLYQFKQVGAGYWIPQMDIWSIPATFWQMLLGIGINIKNPDTQRWVLVAFIFSVIALASFLVKNKKFERWLLLIALLAPFAGSMLFWLIAKIQGSESSVYLVRYFLFASSFFTISLGLWFSELKKYFGYTLLGLLVAINFWAVYHYWDELKVSEKPGMAEAGRYLKNNVKAEDKIFVGSSFIFFNFKYYNETAVRPLLFTGGRSLASQMSHVEGSAILTDQDLGPDLKAGTNSLDTAWLVWTNGFGSSKPTTPDTWQQLEEYGYAEVRPWVGTTIYVTKYRVL